MVWGFFRAILKEMTSPSTVEVITPTAVAAIGGTDLMGEVTADSTTIVVLRGDGSGLQRPSNVSRSRDLDARDGNYRER
jgi:hypothetical protein